MGVPPEGLGWASRAKVMTSTYAHTPCQSEISRRWRLRARVCVRVFTAV